VVVPVVPVVPDVPELLLTSPAPERVVPVPEVSPDVPDVPVAPDGCVLFMPLVPLGPRHVSVPLCVPEPDEPLDMPPPVSVDCEPAALLAPDVVWSAGLVLCFDFDDFCFFLASTDCFWPESVDCVLVDWAATPALTSMAVTRTAMLAFMTFSFGVGWSKFCHACRSAHVGEHAARRSEHHHTICKISTENQNVVIHVIQNL
jgi:hypothetical protein